MAKRGRSSGRSRPYTAHEDQLILTCPYGSMKDLAYRLGRNPKAMAGRKAKLLSNEISMPMHKALERRAKPRLLVRAPFARPDWFEEDLEAMAVVGTRQIRATVPLRSSRGAY